MTKKIIFHEGEFPQNCSGCRLCQSACSFEHEGAFAPWLSRIIIEEKDFRETSPFFCNFCAEPLCIGVCQSGALSRKDSSSPVMLDSAKCGGCRECVFSCLHKAIAFDRERCIPLICDLCGGSPKCVSVCPRGVLSIEG